MPLRSSLAWLVYHIPSLPLCDLCSSVFLEVMNTPLAVRVHTMESVHDYEGSAFAYFGLGDPDGVYASEGFGSLPTHKRHYLLDRSTVGGFPLAPLVCFASFTEVWLRLSEREDWIGFKGYVSNPLVDEKWWSNYLTNLYQAILLTVEGRSSADDLTDIFYKEHARARSDHRSGALRYATVLLTEMLYENLDFGSSIA